MADQRKKYWINPSFQFNLIYYCLIGVVFSILVFYSANSFFFYSVMKKGKKLGLDPSHIYYKLLTEQYDLMNQIFIISASIIFVVLLLYGLFLSHRMAGPLLKLKIYFERLNAGEKVGNLDFRRDDFFRDLVRPISEYVARKEKGEV